MVVESNQNVFSIQIDDSSFADFEISEFEIARVDCICRTAWPRALAVIIRATVAILRAETVTLAEFCAVVALVTPPNTRRW